MIILNLGFTTFYLCDLGQASQSILAPVSSSSKELAPESIRRQKNRSSLNYTHMHVCACVYTHSHTHTHTHSCAKSLQLCLTLCNCMDCSLPGSSVHGILQARILEWIAISFIYICVCVCVCTYMYICMCVYIYVYTHVCIIFTWNKPWSKLHDLTIIAVIITNYRVVE